MLGNTILPCLQHLHVHFIPAALQLIHQGDQQRPSLSSGEIGDILKQHGPRIQPVNHGKETLPQVGPIIENPTVARPYQVAYFGNAGPGERLAGRPSGQEVNVFNAPFIQLVDEVRRVSKVPCPCEALNVRGMGFGCNRVEVCRGDDGEAPLLQSHAQPAGTAEEVYCPRAWTSFQPPAHGIPVVWVWRILMRGEFYTFPSVGGQSVGRMFLRGFGRVIHCSVNPQSEGNIPLPSATS